MRCSRGGSGDGCGGQVDVRQASQRPSGDSRKRHVPFNTGEECRLVVGLAQVADADATVLQANGQQVAKTDDIN